jgi:hypothetical protein
MMVSRYQNVPTGRLLSINLNNASKRHRDDSNIPFHSWLDFFQLLLTNICVSNHEFKRRDCPAKTNQSTPAKQLKIRRLKLGNCTADRCGSPFRQQI